MKICRNCGNSCEEDALFCNQCGTKFELSIQPQLQKYHSIKKTVPPKTSPLQEACQDKDESKFRSNVKNQSDIQIMRPVRKRSSQKTYPQSSTPGYRRCQNCGAMVPIQLDHCYRCNTPMKYAKYQKIRVAARNYTAEQARNKKYENKNESFVNKNSNNTAGVKSFVKKHKISFLIIVIALILMFLFFVFIIPGIL